MDPMKFVEAKLRIADMKRSHSLKNDFPYGSWLTLSDDEQGVQNARKETKGI